MKASGMVRIPVDLVMDDWRQVGSAESIYNTPLGFELSTGDMHSGTVFPANILIDIDVADELIRAWRRHQAYPVMRVIVDLEDPESEAIHP